MTGRVAVLPLAFLVSGCAALVYQVLWTRWMSLVIGSTTFAVSAVLAAFMAGLALGSRIFGRLADRVRRPLRLYAALEAGLAASAFLLPEILRQALEVLPEISSGAGPRAAFAIGILLLPCGLIGGTLPVLVRISVPRADAFGRDFGRLYGLNTLGAGIGAALAGYFLLGRFGLAATNRFAISLNLGLAAFFLLLDRFVPPQDVPPQELPTPSFERDPVRRRILSIAVLSGFSILSLEVLWTRILVQSLWSTSTTFSAVLIVVLVALTLGSWVAGRLASGADSSNDLLRRLAAVQLVFATALLLHLLLLDRIPQIQFAGVLLLGSENSPLIKLLVTTLIVGVPATAGGVVFPTAVQCLREGFDRRGSELGRIAMGNTLAGAIGALGTGYLLIPFCGVLGSYGLLVILQAALATFAGWYSTRRRIWWAACPVVLLVTWIALPAFSRPDPFADPRAVERGYRRLLVWREAVDATFAVYEEPATGDRHLFINGFAAAGNSSFNAYMPLLAHLPLLLHPEPRTAVVIAFGTGSTAGAAARHPLASIEIVDVSREVFDFAHFFHRTNFHVLADARVHVTVEDGRNFIMASRDTYDVITSEPMPPKFAGMIHFYTREYYAAARKRLGPDGIVAQWLPFHLMNPTDARMAAATFLEVHPHAALWMFQRTGILVGGVRPLETETSVIARRIAARGLGEDLRRIGVADAEGLLALRVLDAAGLRRYAADAPILTDDRPALEFSGDPPPLDVRSGLASEREVHRAASERAPSS